MRGFGNDVLVNRVMSPYNLVICDEKAVGWIQEG